jgi:RimJ/RimL family protein N-acetyltransferase
MDLCSDGESDDRVQQESAAIAVSDLQDCAELPIEGPNVHIRAFDADSDFDLLASWLPDRYGRYFFLSCATSQQITVESLLDSPNNHLGIVCLSNGRAIGAMAYLDHSKRQCRAELRKLIGDPDCRGKGLAEEATRLWVQHGISGLGLQKIYVSTLQTQIANIKLNENIGFKVEGLLRNEVLIDGERHDVLRMGLCVTSGDDSQSN